MESDGMTGDPCKCGCGLPVMGRRWYACKCPNAKARADAQYRNLLACQKRRRQEMGSDGRREERAKYSSERVPGDIPAAEIDRRHAQALVEIKARRNAQAA